MKLLPRVVEPLNLSIFAPGPPKSYDNENGKSVYEVGKEKPNCMVNDPKTPGPRGPGTQANVEAIVRAYEETELSAEDIATGFELDKSLVHVVLAQKSRLYRIKENVNDDGTKFDVVSDDDFCELRDALIEMVKSPAALKPADRAKNIRWLIDEKKGRNNLIKTMPVQNNLWQLNMFLRKNDEKYNEGLKRLKQSKEVVGV